MQLSHPFDLPNTITNLHGMRDPINRCDLIEANKKRVDSKNAVSKKKGQFSKKKKKYTKNVSCVSVDLLYRTVPI